MTKLLMDTKNKPRKIFLISDQGNLVKIKQPSVMDTAILYTVLF